MKPRAWLTIVVSAVASASVWALSPWLVGRQEPWDVDGPFYILALAVVGSIAGLLTPRPIWAHYLGAFLGQVAYGVLFLRIGPLFLVGVAFLLGYSVIFLFAAATIGYLRLRFTRRPSHV